MNKQHQKIRNHFKRVDPIIFNAMKNVSFENWMNSHKQRTSGLDYFRALCREIIGQQLSGKSATAILKRFNALFDKGVAYPSQLLNIKDQKLRDAGMSWAKVKYVKNIAEAYIENTVQFNKLHELSDEEITSQLTAIKGVGNWTSEMFLIFTLGREDIFSFGDLGLKKGFSKLYKTDKPTQDQIEIIVSKWKPYTTYGSITLWHILDSEVVETSKKLRK